VGWGISGACVAASRRGRGDLLVLLRFLAIVFFRFGRILRAGQPADERRQVLGPLTRSNGPGPPLAIRLRPTEDLRAEDQLAVHMCAGREHGRATSDQIRPLVRLLLLDLVSLLVYALPVQPDAIDANMYVSQPVIMKIGIFIIDPNLDLKPVRRDIRHSPLAIPDRLGVPAYGP